MSAVNRGAGAGLGNGVSGKATIKAKLQENLAEFGALTK